MPYDVPNYDPTVNPGDLRRRVWRVGMENPIDPGSKKSASFHECEVMRDKKGIEREVEKLPAVTIVYEDPTEVVDVIDLATNAKIGETTLGAILVSLNSLARHAQKKRDVAETARIAAEEAREAARIEEANLRAQEALAAAQAAAAAAQAAADAAAAAVSP